MKNNFTKMYFTLNLMIAIAVVGWTTVCAGSLIYHYADSRRHIEEIARHEAEQSIEKDLLYRHWAAERGGVYVPVSGKTPPNPYLNGFDERDIVTPSGKRLTLVNPSYMTRQVHELGEQKGGLIGHMTSLRPVRPENGADEWERKALEAVMAGQKEFGEVVFLNGLPNYRLMKPLFVEKPCLGCHTSPEYALGDLRGGISVSVPLGAFTGVTHDHLLSEARHFGGVWVLGLVGIFIAAPYVRQRIREQEQAAEKVGQSEQQLRAVLDNAPFGAHMYRRERDGRLVLTGANPAADRILGVEHRQLLGRAIDEAFPVLTGVSIPEAGGRNAESAPWQRDGVEYTHSGSLGAMDIHVFHTSPREIAVFFRDVTERWRAEQALRESEALLREAQRIGRIGHWKLDVVKNALWCSDEVYRIFDVDPRRVITREAFLELVHPDDRERVNDAVREYMRSGAQSLQLEYRIVRRDGSVRHLCDNSRADLDDRGNISGRSGTVQDVTEMKTADEALRRSEELSRTIIAAEPECVKILGEGSVVKFMNPAGLAMIDADDAGAVIGKEVLTLVVPEHREAFHELNERVFKGMSGTLEFEIIGLRGKRRWLETHAVPLRDGSGKVESLLGITRDITERKRAERTNRELQQQLLQAQKIESVGRLAGGIAHDINNMLTPILGYAEMLSSDLPEGDANKDGLHEIMNAAERMREMTRQLLAFARKQTLEMRNLDINEVVSRFSRMLRRTLRDDVRISLNLTPSAGSVMADERQIEQVVLNLAVNAQDAMPAGGVLMISTNDVVLDADSVKARPGLAPGRYLLLKVADTGMGMDNETLSRIFEPFFTTKESGRGTGLGLATVYGIVKQHRGYIDVESEPRQGATFSLYLPVSGDAAGEASEEKPAGLQRGSETILVVEDQAEVIRIVQRLLGTLGYRVLTAMNADEARAALQTEGEEIELLLTDVIMPVVTGKELYENLKQSFPSLKVIYMSGYPADVIGKHGALDSGVHFIRKPFTIQELSAKVRKALDSEPPG